MIKFPERKKKRQNAPFAEFLDQVPERVYDTIDELAFFFQRHVHALSWVRHCRCGRRRSSTTWMGCQGVIVLECSLRGMAAMPVVVVYALTVPVKDVHVVNHDDGRMRLLASLRKMLSCF